MARKNPTCGVCGKTTVRVPIPSSEQGPYLSVWLKEGSGKPGHLQVLGPTSKVPDRFRKKYGEFMVEVVPVQFGCTKCDSIMTYWMRRDGKRGDLHREIAARKSGFGTPVFEGF